MNLFFAFLFAGFPEPEWRVSLEKWDIYQPGLVAIDAEGGLCLADQANARLLFFGPNGTFQKVVGQKGSGPGEFQEINQLAWDGKHQRFLVVDTGNGRITSLTKYGIDAEQLMRTLGKRILLTSQFLEKGTYFSHDQSPSATDLNMNVHGRDSTALIWQYQGDPFAGETLDVNGRPLQFFYR